MFLRGPDSGSRASIWVYRIGLTAGKSKRRKRVVCCVSMSSSSMPCCAGERATFFRCQGHKILIINHIARFKKEKKNESLANY